MSSPSASTAAGLAALSSLMMTPTTSTVNVPKRGGTNPIFGTYVGGSPLNCEYRLTKITNFKASSQLRTPKNLSTLESALNSSLLDSSSLKFNGSLDTTSTTTEINKEQFITAVRRSVKKFGFQSLFTMPSTDNLSMVCLTDHPHSFSLDQVIKEFTDRNITEPTPILDSTNNETDESITNRFKCYDDYEAYDISLSRLVMETLTHPVLRETIETRYDHLDDFLDLPGQVYFAMALEACHASTALDISTASKTLNAFKLSTFPGENINEFSTSVLRQVKIVQSGWAIPFDTGSSILHKVTGTESEYFNRTMFTLLDKVSEMEDSCGEAGNPKLLMSHKDYPSFGPIGICAFMQNTYGTLVKKGKWPALTTTIPEGNFTAANDSNTSSSATNLRRKNTDGKRCRICGSVFHFARVCPDADIQQEETSSTNISNQDTTPSGPPDNSSRISDSSSWRYEAPSDVNATITRNNRTYYYCSKCVCNRSGRRGFYNRTHSTRDHRGGVTSSTSTTPITDNTTSSTTIDAPAGNHSPHTSSAELPESANHVDSDPNGLQFEGAFVASVDCDDGAWMASINIPSDDEENGDVLDAAGVTLTDLTLDDRPDSPQVLYCDSCGNEGLPYTKCECEGLFCSDVNDYAPWSSSEDEGVESNKDDYVEFLYCDDCGNPGLAYVKCNCEGIYCLSAPPDCVSQSSESDTNATDSEQMEMTDSNATVPAPITKTKIQEQPYLTYFDTYSSLKMQDSTDIFYDCETHHMLPSTVSSASSLILPHVLVSYFHLLLLSITLTVSSYVTTWIHLLLTLKTTTLLTLFYISTLFWDSVDLLYLLPSVKPIPQNKSTNQFRSYPRRWMILTTYMLFSGSHLVTPATYAFNTIRFTPSVLQSCLQQTALRTSRLHNLITLDLPTILSYNVYRISEWRSHIQCSAPEPAPTAISTSPISLPSQPDTHFFAAYSTPSELEGATYLLDYFECRESVLPTISSLDMDWLNLGSITDDVHHVTIYGDEHLGEPSSPALTMITNDDDPGHQPSANHTASQMGKVDLLLSSSNSSNPFQVIFDTGASLAISPSKQDFSGPISPLPVARFLGGMANGLRIEGIGNIRWGFKMGNKLLIIHSRCYYVPEAKARLISPQRLFNAEKGVDGHFLIKETHSILHYAGVGDLRIDYDSKNHLPIALGKPISGDLTSPHVNLAVLNDTNQNLTPAQKLLLTWHSRFGHKGFQHLQTILRGAPFLSIAFKAASRCIIPRCEVCEYSKAHRQPTHGSTQKRNLATEGALKSGQLRAGNRISVDHFESRLKGRTLQSRGRTTSDQYVGGCIFVDHMSGYIHVEPQLGFSSSETIRAKQNFEKLSLDHGVLIDSYMADNGVFKANAFVQHIRTHNQKLKYCGVNAHHQNAIAERSIRTVSECARALLLHASLHWKEGIDSSLWPMAVEYATHIYNTLPNTNGVAPADLFTGVQVPRHKLKDMHVWGAPVYVLDPTLQQGRKLPRWEPRARRGIFVGFSRVHSSDVPLILNTRTGHISPQYHVVFDDSFSTVESLSANDDPPPFWNQIGFDETVYSTHVHRIPLDDGSEATLSPEWMTPAEVEARTRAQVRDVNVRNTFTQPPASSAAPIIPATSTTTSLENEGALSNPSPPIANPSSLSQHPSPPVAPTANSQIAPTSPSLPRHHPRERKRPELYIPTFLSSIDPIRHSSQSADLAYTAELNTDMDTGEIHCTDPRAYAAKTKPHDPDQPSYHEAMSGPNAPEYVAAMKKEIRQLIKQNTWLAVPRTTVPRSNPVLAGTWAFKLKRLPDGSPLKFKARYCIRGDLQREGVDFFDTYAPVVQWSTVRMLLTLTLSKGWTTKQVDYNNAFAQAELKETVFIEPPKGFTRKDGLDRVLRLITSLYGLRQAPKTFFEKLRDGLLERGFRQSDLDPCLFLKDKMICVVYVDDTIIAGPDSVKIEELISSLGVRKDEQRHTFALRDEGEVGDFLGIRIEKTGPRQFKLSQPGLIQKVIKTADMEDCNSTRTPALTTPLGSDKDGSDFSDKWSYPTVVGMLMFLANNSRPDIAYAVHQCARFTHCPKDSHAAGVKRIIRYLKGTNNEGMFLEPTSSLAVDCYVDADFAGLWKSEDDQDPLCVKSRSGHVITFMGCPLQWQSKLQTQIALSTMEAEYIALSLAMRELIAVRVVLKEIFTHVFHSPETKITYSTIAKGFSLPASTVYEDNEACLKFASMPKMSPQTKHIAIPYHFFCSKVKELEIKVVGIDTKRQLADQFTKGLPQDKFEHDRKILLGW